MNWCRQVFRGSKGSVTIQMNRAMKKKRTQVMATNSQTNRVVITAITILFRIYFSPAHVNKPPPYTACYSSSI
jgi:hypothetical protein